MNKPRLGGIGSRKAVKGGLTTTARKGQSKQYLRQSELSVPYRGDSTS